MTDWQRTAIALPASLAASWLLTGAMRQYALKSKLMDTPNERSSHTAPTPRGGGVAIVVAFLVALVAIWSCGTLETGLIVAILGAGTLVATLGFVDDRVGLSAGKRFIGHAVASFWVLAWMGNIPKIPIFGMQVELGFFGSALSLLFAVWMINLFNFMDGIDGIAGVEAITVSIGGGLLWYLTGPGTGWAAAFVFAACVAGFLAWNFPPAKIFMGDAGSGFLGVVIAALALWCGHAAPSLFWSWFILIGCFMVDATTTLVRRVRRGERFSQPHRTHAYQYASRRHAGHGPVTLSVLGLNLLWLLPIATLVAFGVLDGVLGVTIAYAPLVWLAFRYKAGDRKHQEV